MDLVPGEGFRRRAAARRPFDGVFLTHAHMGHYLGLAHLGREALGTAPTACYCTERMAAFLRSNGPWSLMVDEGRLVLDPLEYDTWRRVSAALEVKAIPVPHREEYSDTVGFVFRGPRRALLYLPDIDRWASWSRRIEDVVREVDIALLDGSFYSADEVPGRPLEQIPHPLIPDSMSRLSTAVRAGHEVVFTHMNNSNPVLDDGGPAARAVLDAGFGIATEGTTLPL
jgi:pyrroloquinoline quinone biosynthesis protein B